MSPATTAPGGPSAPFTPTKTGKPAVSKLKSKLEQASDSAKGGKSPSRMPSTPPLKQTITSAKQGAANAPVDFSALKGLEVGDDGKIYGRDGKALGRVADGDPNDLIGQVVGDYGEILDEEGDAIGRVEVVPEVGEELDKGASQDEGKTKGAVKNAPVDFDSLQGLKVSEGGEIKSSSGEVVAKVVEGDPDDLVGFALNNQGEVIDEDGDAIGRVETVTHGGKDISTGQDEGNIEENGISQRVKDSVKQATKSPAANVSADDAGYKDRAPGLPDISQLAGFTVNDRGEVVDDSGNVRGKLEEGNLEEIVGKEVNERGLVLDNDGNIIGKVAVIESAADTKKDKGSNLPPLSIMEGLKCNKQGKIVDVEGKPVGELVEGNARAIWKHGGELDLQGQFWDNKGRVIGKAKPIEQEEEEEDTPFSGFQGLVVGKGGWVEDQNGNKVGQIVQGDSKKLEGRVVDRDGDILDNRGNVIGHAERHEEEEPEPETEPEKEDLRALKGLAPNKQGNVMGTDGIPIGRVVDGNPKHLAGKRIDEIGRIWNDNGKAIGQCELIPEAERDTKAEGPFAGLEGLVVVNDGLVEDENGNVVGKVADGDAKQLRGRAVDEDGDIVDKYGNVKGHVEPYEPPEEEVMEEDLSPLAGRTINKAGNIVDESGVAIGRLLSGDPKKLSGRKVDDKGQIWGDKGQVIGKVELIPEAERDKPEGPFSGLEHLTIGNDGGVRNSSGQIVGRVVEGDVKKLMGRPVDEDGDIIDKSGNVLGKVERWEPEEKKRDISPMSGRKVNKKGEIRDADGNLIGMLTEGNLTNLAGKSVDDNGYVVDNDGNKIGECTLLENMPEKEPEISPEQLEAEKQSEQERELAKKMCAIIQQTLDKVGAAWKMIKEHTERADRAPKDELDEEELVRNVKPLIEEGGRHLQECNGALRALDPDGRIAARAKSKSAQRDASPEEHQLADLLKELTSTVATTIDNARKRIADMPHAKKKLNPLWALLSEPLFQIITAVGLLLTGVLGLVGRLLNGLGLGGLVNGLLGGLGINKLLGELGLGSVTDALNLGGDKKK
ncbi:hypothetical protein AJ78_04224 [Emergomyces pasteurianus Ep9510]|uniref:DUF6987 domain-containing protein n=1 Tax=Emergomyces pasteurianus Ep9510 TaxID=1447872 RepID=A0A1J9PGH4_9EURO|nr:hypothetical protein AJ78_04224 [Emergomyces pasteurianus Ep9510]